MTTRHCVHYRYWDSRTGKSSEHRSLPYPERATAIAVALDIKGCSGCTILGIEEVGDGEWDPATGEVVRKPIAAPEVARPVDNRTTQDGTANVKRTP